MKTQLCYLIPLFVFWLFPLILGALSGYGFLPDIRIHGLLICLGLVFGYIVDYGENKK